MKKQSKQSKLEGLTIDVLELVFTKWLTWQGVLDSFRRNYEIAELSCGDFHSCLRSHIQYCLYSQCLDPTHFISSAFLFFATPEGDEFWRRQSISWGRFYSRFASKFKTVSL